MRYDDWGVRSQQWAGLRSVSTSVCGVPVHYVRAEPLSAAAHKAPVHLLVPPMTGSASMWIDLVPHVDLWLDGLDAAREHGTVRGHTATAFASVLNALFITRRPTTRSSIPCRFRSLCCGEGTIR